MAEELCEFSTRKAFLSVIGVSPSWELSVDKVSRSRWHGSHCDPSIFSVPPARQARDYAFLTPATYYSDFVTITFAEGTTLTLDGEAWTLVQPYRF